MDTLLRLLGYGWCLLTGALAVSVTTNRAGGIPHDSFAGLFGLGLIFTGALSLDAKRPREHAQSWHPYIWLELFVYLGFVGTLACVPATSQSGLFEFIAFSLYIFQLGFRYFEVDD